MAKIALNVNKRANNLAVRGETGTYPLSIEIYKNTIKYFSHLIELADKGNQIISCGMKECLTVVNKVGKRWLTSVLYIFNLVGINPDMEQLHSISNVDILSSIVDKLKSIFKEKFFHGIANFSKLILYSYVKEKFGEFTRLSTTNIDQRLPNSESRLIRFQLKMEDGRKLHVRNACVFYVFRTTWAMKSIIFSTV